MKTATSLIQQPKSKLWHRNLTSAIWGDYTLQAVLVIIGCIPAFITIAIMAMLIYETAIFFQQVPLWRFLTDTQWTPLFPNKTFGIMVLTSGTLLTTAIAMTVAVPIGLLTAIYLSEYAPQKIRYLLKPVIETLSGIPTVVYGYFALLCITPLLQKFIPNLAGFSPLSAGLVTGVMVVPIVSSMSEDAIQNVPQKLREAAYALGFTQPEIITKIILPLAFPGIIASFTLAASRSLGETLIASIAAGQIPTLTLNPLEPVSTITAFIIQLSLGDVAFNSLEFHTIFTLGTVIFLMTSILNTLSYLLVRRHRDRMLEVTIYSPEVETQNLAINYKSKSDRYSPEKTPKSRHIFQPAFAKRHLLDRLFKIFSIIPPLFPLTILGLLLVDVFQNGFSHLNWQFITAFASRDPKEAGIYVALVGTFWLLGLTAIFAIPIGVGAAIYLEEYLPDNLLSQFLEINLANLAAIPSIIYGLLGLGIFVYGLGFLTGQYSIISAGLTLSIIALPALIIATRSALRQVPDSLREGGSAMGMTRWQVLWHLVLPSAMPGILTGIFLSLSRAIGETAPLIAVGASTFIVFTPALSLEGLQSPFTALPVQIFNWVSRPEADFQQNAAAAIILLIGILLAINIFAIILRYCYGNKKQ
ncbi:MAG: phosphate ABC transporter permease PstA [Oscillatoriaceae cyanobacterium Prado104]|jgi:phosphate transport system permease protein|nr:phosphate ABC transporter permease PstA [Oscillatoriaceae cyanobacterium Prado104]